MGYEQITLRAFIFVGVRNEEKCIAAPSYSRFTALVANAFVLVAVSLATRTAMTTDKVGASPDPALKASRRGYSSHD